MRASRRGVQLFVGAGLTVVCLTLASVASPSALAGGWDHFGRRCSNWGGDAHAMPSGFPQPEVRRSRHGVLDTTMHACVAINRIEDQPSGDIRRISTPTFEGTILGPTLKLKPGDTLSIDLINGLPANRTKQRMGAFPHDPYTLNFHAHGMQVSPLGNSDNIFRRMPPGTKNPIKIEIPDDHPSGTFWYHPHKHGAVTFQFLAGMAGFLIVEGGPGTLDAVPEVAAAKDVAMGFQVIRTGVNGKSLFVNEKAQQFGTFPIGTMDKTQQGVWSPYGLDGAPGRSYFYYTTNGVTNPTLHMRPGEVQRWRLLNASAGVNLEVALQDHGLNIVAMDGITVENMYQLEPGAPIAMGPGQRMDVLVKAGKPGTYTLQALDPGNPLSVSPSGVDPAPRTSRHSFDFPAPCAAVEEVPPPSPHPELAAADPCTTTPPGKLTFPIALATIVVEGSPKEMKLPANPLPVPQSMPSVATMLERTPDARRNVAFEICGNKVGTSLEDPSFRLPSCGWYFAKYDAAYWGGAPFNTLLMMRDGDDTGQPSNPPNPEMPLVDFQKDGLFNAEQPLFPDMIAGNYEEWTVVNHSFSDHPFHIHQNPFLVTKINDMPLETPEWHDTIIVPGAIPQPTGPTGTQPNINTDAKIGSITFRTYFDPRTVGCFVMHCHALQHEDVGMMQRLDLKPGPGEPSGCVVTAIMDHQMEQPLYKKARYRDRKRRRGRKDSVH